MPADPMKPIDSAAKRVQHAMNLAIDLISNGKPDEPTWTDVVAIARLILDEVDRQPKKKRAPDYIPGVA